MVKIAFYSKSLNVRGTCTAIFDYAHYNEILLNNESIIISKKWKILNNVYQHVIFIIKVKIVGNDIS